MAQNEGIAPPQTDTDLGRLRVVIGDTSYTVVSPGIGSYTMFGDAELEAFLEQSDDSIWRAAGWAYTTLASQAALQSSSIKDYDLAVDTKNRSADLLKVAQAFFDQADLEDNADAFEIVSTGKRCEIIPELAPPFLLGCSCRGVCVCGRW